MQGRSGKQIWSSDAKVVSLAGSGRTFSSAGGDEKQERLDEKAARVAPRSAKGSALCRGGPWRMRLTTGPGREVDRHELSGSRVEDRHGSLHSLGMRETPDIPHGSNPIANVVSNSLPNDGSFI